MEHTWALVSAHLERETEIIHTENTSRYTFTFINRVCIITWGLLLSRGFCHVTGRNDIMTLTSQNHLKPIGRLTLLFPCSQK